MDFIQRFIEGFRHAVIYDQRYLVYLDGLKVTILISIFAILIGVAIGLFIAFLLYTSKTEQMIQKQEKKWQMLLAWLVWHSRMHSLEYAIQWHIN